MANFPKAWQGPLEHCWPSDSKNAALRPVFAVGTPPAKFATKPDNPANAKQTGSQEHVMFNSFEAKKTFSAILCTILFSATCVLSAVGPAGAVEVHPASVASSVRA
jgi:hypothetical protein